MCQIPHPTYQLTKIHRITYTVSPLWHQTVTTVSPLWQCCGSYVVDKKIHRNVCIMVLKSKRTKRRIQRSIVCLIWVPYARDINFLMEKKLEKKSSAGFFGEWIFGARLEEDHVKRVRQQN